ncbi:MAG: hypothetical protein ACFN4D_07000, partial [Cardiobacterium sp.]
CIVIAIHRKFQTRRAAEGSTHLYGEAAQHSMRLSVDGYNVGILAALAIQPGAWRWRREIS